MVFDAHEGVRLLACYKGVPRGGVYDNMTTAVGAIFIAKERKFNRRFEQSRRPAHRGGLEKGQVREPGLRGAQALFCTAPVLQDA